MSSVDSMCIPDGEGGGGGGGGANASPIPLDSLFSATDNNYTILRSFFSCQLEHLEV